MLKMIKGAKTKYVEQLNEEFAVDETYISANINEDKILKIINEFVDLQENPLFLIIEVPTKLDDEETKGNVIERLHKDVYYLDDMSAPFVKELLSIFGNLFVNDGLAQIGVGNHKTNAEIMTGKYNVVNIFFGNDDKSKYEKLLIDNKISKVDNLVTAWDLFNDINPGESEKIEENGKTVYDAVEVLKKAGLYFAERRED